MAGPMEGVKVVELGFWVAGPCAAGILADWGADVVKIEPPDGDPFRGFLFAYSGIDDANPPFELDNRGKRSICVDLTTEEGRAIAGRLVEEADVFVTNLRSDALVRAGLDYASLSALNSRLVYGWVTGYGTVGPEADRAAYDIGAFWSRAGVAAALTPQGQVPPWQRGGMGDHMAGMAMAGAVAAALLSRERNGQGQLVSGSLLRIGAYMLGWDLNINLRLGVPTVPMSRQNAGNPVINSYRDRDGKWFWLLGLQGDRHWPDLVRAIDRPDLLTDERFATIRLRMKNAADLVKLLDEAFAQRPLAEWAAVFDRENVWWAPVQHSHDLLTDPQAEAAGVFVEVPMAEGSARMVASPVDFSETRWSPASMAPELGQHTEEVLIELGYDWDQVAVLAERGIIP
jgi:crotonobetainyl-CoA:carnitine CoA-transferase CaiB-like acyl-CoA transferase